MTFTVTEITRCTGQNHWHFTANVDGNIRNITINQTDFQLEPGELESAFITRIRSVVKEANANNFTQARTAILNKEFKI